jgi:MFS family permease
MGMWQALGANRSLLALSFARMGDGIGNSILFIVIPLYISKLSAPHFPYPEVVRAGILISLFGLVFGVAQPFTGALVDRLNRRKPFVIGGLLLLAGATAAYALTDRYLDTLVLRAVQGLGLALTLPATLAIITNTTKRESRGGAMGIFSTFRVASLAAGPLMGGFIYDRFGFDTTFFSGAVFILIGALLVQIWVTEVRIPAATHDPASVRVFDRNLISPPILALGFGTFVMATSIAMIAPLEQVFNARLNVSPTVFGLAFSMLLITRLATQIPTGHLSDRRGRKGLIVWGLVLLAASTAPMGYVTAAWQLMTLRAIQGVASGAIAAPTFALGGDLSCAGGEGRQMSIITMGFGLGIAVGTLMAGLLAVVSLALPFLAAAVAMVVASWTVFRVVPETVTRAVLPESEWSEEARIAAATAAAACDFAVTPSRSKKHD